MNTSLFKSLIVSATSIAFIGLSINANAKVDVKLIEPNSFHDIQINDQSKKRSLETVEAKITQLFEQLGKKYLPKKHKVMIEITDIDLAGNVEHMVGPNQQSLRVVKDNSPYRLSFKFSVFNSTGEKIHHGNRTIKNFANVSSLKSRHKSDDVTSHFEDDLEKWFKRAFK